MTIEAIFALQLFSSLLMFGLIAKWLVLPAFVNRSQNQLLFWLILPHTFRYIGMVFLVPGVVSSSLPDYFAYPAAFGDLIAAALALLAIVWLRAGWTGAHALVWVFNLVGTLDLLYALRNTEVIPFLQASWYIPTMLVPLLLVTHFMIFRVLILPAARKKPDHIDKNKRDENSVGMAG